MEAAASVFYRNTDCISGVIGGMLFPLVESNQRLQNWYLLLHPKVRSIDEYEQILGGSESD
jgi:hypothetical protein